MQKYEEHFPSFITNFRYCSSSLHIPQRQSIRAHADIQATNSSLSQPTSNPPNQESLTLGRAGSVSPVDISPAPSLSTTNSGESKSRSSSNDISPIEDVHSRLTSRWQADTQHHRNFTAPSHTKLSDTPSVLLTEPKGVHATYRSSSSITPSLQDDTSGIFTSSGSRVLEHGAFNLRFTPKPMGGVPPPQQSKGTCSPNPYLKSIRQPGGSRSTKFPAFDGIETTQNRVHNPKRSPSEPAEQPKPEATPKREISLTVTASVEGSEKCHSHPWPAAKNYKSIDGESTKTCIQDEPFHAKWHRSRIGDQPSSRFSDTSCSTALYDSPPSTLEANLERRVPIPASSILSHKRPVQGTGIRSFDVTTRKPTPSDIQKTNLKLEKQKTSKPLPKSPPEAQAVTRVASLEAKLEALRCRRANLETVVQELTSVPQRSPIVYDMASRQEIKKTVDGLNNELSEVRKEEHETGLQLHRAWKRSEETSALESSSLWVRRLAS
jgi:hypothetical protein